MKQYPRLRHPTPSFIAALALGGWVMVNPACRTQEHPPAAAPPAPAAPAPSPPPAAPSVEAVAPPAEAGGNADRYFRVIEPHLERVSIYEGAEVFLRELAKTPERARHLLTAHWCVSEVSNGGFQQFFAGAAGVMGPESVVGLRALGLNDNAVLLEQAMAILGAKYPREMARRNQLLKRLARTGQGKAPARQRADADTSPFAALDEQFLQALQARPGGFDAAAAAYAKAGSSL